MNERQRSLASALSSMPQYSGWNEDEIFANVNDVFQSGDQNRLNNFSSSVLSSMPQYTGWTPDEIHTNIRDVIGIPVMPENKMDAIPYLQDMAPKVSSFRATPLPMNKDLWYAFGDETNMPVVTGSEATKTATQQARSAPLSGTPYNEMNQVKPDVPISGFDSFLAGATNVAGGIVGELTKPKTRTLETTNADEMAKYNRGEAIRQRAITSKDPQFLRSLTPEEKADYDFSRSVTIPKQPVTGKPATESQVFAARAHELETEQKSNDLSKKMFETADNLATLEEQSNALRERILDRNIYNDMHSEAWNNGDISLQIDLLGAQAAARGDTKSAEVVQKIKKEFENKYANNVPTENLQKEFTGALQKLKNYTDLKTDYDSAVNQLPSVQAARTKAEQLVNALPEVQQLIAAYQDKATPDMTPAQVTALSNDLTREIEQLPQVKALYDQLNNHIVTLDEVKQLHTSFMDKVNTLPEVKVMSDKLNKDIEQLNPKNKNWFTKLTTSTVEMLPPLVKGGALSTVPIVGQAAAGTMWAAQGAGNTFNNLIKDGVPPEKARAAAALVGPIYAGIEMIQFGQITRMPALKEALEKGFTKMALQLGKQYGFDVLKETNEEGLQGVTQTVGEEIAKGTKPEEIAKLAVKSYYDNVVQSIGPLAIVSAPAKIGAGAKTVADKKAEQYAGDIAADTKLNPSVANRATNQDGTPAAAQADTPLSKPLSKPDSKTAEAKPETKRDKVLSDFNIKDEDFWQSENRDEVFSQLTPEEQHRLAKLDEPNKETEAIKQKIVDFDSGKTPFPVEKTLSTEEARTEIERIRKSGKHGGTKPFEEKISGEHIYTDAFPLSLLDAEEIETLNNASRPELVEKYAEEGPTREPVYILKTRKGSWYVSDGGHRITAAIKRGDTTIPAIVEYPEYETSKEQPAALDETTRAILEHNRPAAIQKEMLNVNTAPTPDQANAGNYQKAHYTRDGLQISIETPAGATRHSKPDSKRPWSQTLNHDYGYIRGTKGHDKDKIDVFIAPETTADEKVYVINQIHPETGEFDEHKVMMGFESAEAAQQAYLSNYEPGWQGLKSIVEYPVEYFKTWVKSDATMREAQPMEGGTNGKEKTTKTETLLSSNASPEMDGAKVTPLTKVFDPKIDVPTATKILKGRVNLSPENETNLAADLLDAIATKDPETLEEILAVKGDTRAVRGVFQAATGISMPSTIPEARVTIQKFVGDELYRDFTRDKIKRRLASKVDKPAETSYTSKGTITDEGTNGQTEQTGRHRPGSTSDQGQPGREPGEQTGTKAEQIPATASISRGTINPQGDGKVSTDAQQGGNPEAGEQDNTGTTTGKVKKPRARPTDRKIANVEKTLPEKQYSIEYRQQEFFHHLHVALYNALRGGWIHEGKVHQGSYTGWLRDFNIITDAVAPAAMKSGTISDKAEAYLQSIVDNTKEMFHDLQEIGLEIPEHTNDVRNWLEQSKGKKEFERYHNSYENEHQIIDNDAAIEAAQKQFFEDHTKLTPEQRELLEEAWQDTIEHVLALNNEEPEAEAEEPKYHHETTPEATINAIIEKSSGVADALTFVPRPGTEEYALAEDIATAFGVKIHWFRQGEEFKKSMGGIGGIFLSRNSQFENTLFIGEKTKTPVINTIGHELLHRMRQKHPDLYEYLKDAFMSEASEEYYTSLMNYTRAYGTTIDVSQEELIAEFTGEQFTDRTFWDKLYLESPAAFKAAIKILHDLIAKALKVLRAGNNTALLNDIQKVRDVLVDVTREYQKREQNLAVTVIDRAIKLTPDDLKYSREDIAVKFTSMEKVNEANEAIQLSLDLFDEGTQLDLFYDAQPIVEQKEEPKPEWYEKYGMVDGLNAGESRIIGNWKKHHYIDLNGTVVNRPSDVAQVFSIYRHPFMEHVTFVYVNKDNVVVGHNALTIGLANASIGMETKNDFYALNRFKNRMNRLNATGYYILHNHPGGSMKASQADLNLTRKYMRNVEGFKGHIIYDHKEYVLITGSKPEALAIDVKSFVEPKESYSNGLENAKRISGHWDVIAIGKNIINKHFKAAVLVLNNANQIISWYPITNVNGINAQNFHQIVRNAGGVYGVFVSETKYTYKKAVKIVQENRNKKFDSILDVMYVSNKRDKNGRYYYSSAEQGTTDINVRGYENYRFDNRKNGFLFQRYRDENQLDLFSQAQAKPPEVKPISVKPFTEAPNQLDLFSQAPEAPAVPKPEQKPVPTVPPKPVAPMKAIEQTNIFDKATPIPEAKQEITDFGEKIGGAKKDYFAKLSDSENFDIASNPLSKTWPEPDYDELIAGGVDPYLVAYAHAARDEVPTKPQKGYKLNRWIEEVLTLRTLSKKWLTQGNVSKENIGKILEVMNFKYIPGRAELYERLGHSNSFKGISFFSHHFLQYHNEKDVTKWLIEKKAASSSFSNWPTELASGNTKEEALDNFAKKLEAQKAAPAVERKIPFDIYSYRKDPTVSWIGKKTATGYVDLFAFQSSKEAREFLRENYDQVLSRFESYKTIGNERRAKNNPRVGTDYRKGKDVTPEMFSEAFGFRGVEFGNWVEQGKRQEDLNLAYDSLMDLAIILNIPSRALSLNGKLGLAFGARGYGGKHPAKAHYEPDYIVINLTKENGAGSLAHEWWHAFDHYMNKHKALNATELPVVKTVSYGAKFNDRFKNDSSLRNEMITAFGELIRAIEATKLKQRSEELDKRRSKAYWSTVVEMTARSFENYIIERLTVLKMTNDYLANINNAHGWAGDMVNSFMAGKTAMDSYPYLTEDEVAPVVAAYNALFAALRQEKTPEGTIALFQREGNTQIYTPEFKRWFGDWEKNPENASKVVDENGKPLIVFHGSNKTFNSFDANKIGQNYNESVGGFFFTDNNLSAKNYAELHSSAGGKANVFNVYLNIKKPYQDNALDYYAAVDKFDMNSDIIINTAKENGNDGIIIASPTGSLYVVFNPNQIKSAIGNNGQFSSDNPDIRYQRDDKTDLFGGADLSGQPILDLFGKQEQLFGKPKEPEQKKPATKKPEYETGDLFAGTTFADTRTKTQKAIDAELQRREAERKLKQKNNILEGTPLFDKKEQEARATQQETLPLFQREAMFYSPLLKAVQGLKQEKGTGEQMLNMIIKSPGAKRDEWKWIGLDDFLKNKTSVTKQEIIDFVNENQVVIKEQTKRVLESSLYSYEGAKLTLERIKNELDTTTIYASGIPVRWMYKTATGEARDLPAEYIDDVDAVYEVINNYEATGEQQDTIFADENLPKYAAYTLRGGKKYREVLLRLPIDIKKDMEWEKKQKEIINKYEDKMYEAYKNNGDGIISKRIINRLEFERDSELNELAIKYYTPDYKSSHWDEKNVFAHARLTDRTYSDEKVLFIEEIQSDWEREARQRGIIGNEPKVHQFGISIGGDEPNLFFNTLQEAEARINLIKNDFNEPLTIVEVDRTINKMINQGVPNQPFLKNWHEVVLKRILRMAAEEGYDRVAWVTGKQTADRYNLAKYVDTIKYREVDEGLWSVKVFDKNMSYIYDRVSLTKHELENLLGKDVTEKIVNDVGVNAQGMSFDNWKVLNNQQLQIGGEWAINLYDKVIPQFLGKYGKKWGAAVETIDMNQESDFDKYSKGWTQVEIDTKDEIGTQQSIPVTDAMKESVLQEGQPLFQREPKPEYTDFLIDVHENGMHIAIERAKKWQNDFDQWAEKQPLPAVFTSHDGSIYYLVTPNMNKERPYRVTYFRKSDTGEMIPLGHMERKTKVDAFDEVKFDNYDHQEAIRFQREAADTFYSPLLKAVQTLKQEKGTGEQMFNMLVKAPGVKEAEWKWIGLDDFLKNKTSVTKQELIDFINENQVKIGEETFSAPKFDKEKALEKIKDDIYNEVYSVSDLWHDRINTIRKEQIAEIRENAEIKDGRIIMDYGNERHTYFRDTVDDVDDYEIENDFDLNPNDMFDLIPDDEKNTLYEELINNKYTMDRRLEDEKKIFRVDYEDPTQYSEYTLDDGTNYRELLLIVPLKPKEPIQDEEGLNRRKKVFERYKPFIERLGNEHTRALTATPFDIDRVQLLRAKIRDIENRRDREADKEYDIREKPNEQHYQSKHWSFNDVFAHTRLTDRFHAEEKVLFIEEIQSDWERDIRKEGTGDIRVQFNKVYTTIHNQVPEVNKGEITKVWSVYSADKFIDTVYADTERQALKKAKSIYPGFPDQPFTKNWIDVVLKRILRMAAEEGYDRVAWVTGKQTADRYSLAKYIDSIGYQKRGEDNYNISVFGKGSSPVWQSDHASLKDIEEQAGKDVAQRIKEGVGRKENNITYLEDINLNIGGEWAINLYDKVIPQFFEKYGKKWGIKVEKIDFANGDNYTGEIGTQQSIPITDEMKTSVMYEGQPLFQRENDEKYYETDAEMPSYFPWDKLDKLIKLKLSHIKDPDERYEQYRNIEMLVSSYISTMPMKNALESLFRDFDKKLLELNSIVDPYVLTVKKQELFEYKTAMEVLETITPFRKRMDTLFQREKSPLAPFEKLAEASQLIEDRIRKSQQYQKEINRLRYQLRTIPETALDKRAIIEVQIDKATDKRIDEIRQAIYEYAAKIGLRGVPYNKVDLLLKNAKTIKGLQRALNTMDEVYDRTRIKELRDEVYKVIWDRTKKLNRLQNAKVPSNMDREGNRALRDYLDKLMYKTDNIDKERLQKFLTWLQRDAAGKMTDKEMDEIPKSLVEWLDDMSKPIPSIAEETTKGLFTRSIDAMTANELQDVLDDIKSIEANGKTRRQIESEIKLENERIAVDAMAGEIIRKRQPSREKPIRGETLDERAKKARTLWNTIKQLPWQARDIDRIIVALTGKTSGTALEQYILKPMAAANTAYKRAMKQVDAFVQKTYGKLSVPELRKPWMEITIHQAQSTGSTVPFTRTITQEEGMFVYANSKNEAQAEHLYATLNYTDRNDAIRVVNDIVAKLPDELKQAVEAQWEYFDKVQWARMNEVFSKAHNIDMGHEHHYMPATNLDRGGDGINIDADLMMRAAKQASSDIGSTKNRIVMGPDPRKVVDPNQGPVEVKAAPFRDMLYFSNIVPAMRQAEHYIAFYEPVFQTNRYLGKPAFINALDAHDPAVAGVLMDWLKAMAYGKWSYGQGHEFFDAIIRYFRGAAGRYQILGRVTSLLLQASSAPRGFVTIHPKYALSSLAAILKNPVDFFRVVNHKSAEIEGRMKDWDQTISEWAESEDAKKLLGKWNPIDRAGELLGDIIGGYDKFWASYIWYAKYTEALNKNLSEEDAIYEADKVVRKTQSGGGILASNRLQRGGDMYRAFTQFLSDAVKAYNLLDETAQAWKTLPPSQKASYIVLGILVPALITHIIRTGGEPLKDPLNYAKELITQVTGALPFVGQVVDYATIYGINKIKKHALGQQVNNFSLTYAGDVDAPALSMASDIATELTAADRAKTPGKVMYHLFNAVALAIGLPGGGQIKRTWGGIEETAKTGDARNLILPKAAVQKPKHTMINILNKTSRPWNEERGFLQFYNALSPDAKSRFIERAMSELQLTMPEVIEKIDAVQESYFLQDRKFDAKERSLERKLEESEITKQEYDEKVQVLQRDRTKYEASLRK